MTLCSPWNGAVSGLSQQLSLNTANQGDRVWPASAWALLSKAPTCCIWDCILVLVFWIGHNEQIFCKRVRTMWPTRVSNYQPAESTILKYTRCLMCVFRRVNQYVERLICIWGHAIIACNSLIGFNLMEWLPLECKKGTFPGLCSIYPLW
jgi:hypothetical protein